MALTPLKALLFIGGGILAAGAVAYVSGALDPYFTSQPPAAVATAPGDSGSQAGEASPDAGQEKAAQQDEAAPSAPAEQDTAPQAAVGETAPADSAAGAMKPATPEAETHASAADESEVGVSNPTEQAAKPSSSSADQPVVPTFDVVRVDGNGSLVVAGNAAPGAKVDLLSGELVLGSIMAGPDGAFVFVLDDPLKPGDYQLRLRATAPDSAVVASQQSAVVSVPEKPGGQVLAMVEEPGKATEILTAPEPVEQETPAAAGSTQAAPAEAAAPQAPAVPAAPVETTAAPEAPPAAAEAQPARQEPPASDAPAAPKVAVEAVEIEGSKIFVAGVADPGRKVRAYANEILLGDAQASPDGHFLVEAARDLPVGTYTVRVDALDADGAKVVARATVPFEREPGESMAAVAPEPSESAPAPAAPAQDEPEAAAQAEPAEGKPADVAAASQGDIPETVSPKLEQADGAVIIRRRDTLWHISRRVYGHGIRYTTIYLANQDQIRDPDLIWPGQVFRVPGKSEQGEPANLDALGDQAAPVSAR